MAWSAELAAKYAADATVSVGDFVFHAGYDVSTGVSVSTGTTPVVWGTVVTGECEYYYTDSSGVKSLKTAPFTASTMMNDAYILCSSDDLFLQAHSTGGTGNSPSLYTASGNRVDLRGGSYYVFDVTDRHTGLTSSQSAYMYIGSTAVPYIQGQTPSYPYRTAASIANFAKMSSKGLIFSNSSSHHASVVVPMSEGDVYSFDDARQMIIDAVEESMESGETLDPADIPTWEELYPTELTTDPTEPTDINGDIAINVENGGVLNVYANFSASTPISVSGDVSIGAGAFGTGAFGAGAVTDVDVTIGAGAFGAGAFGAGAVGDVTVSGNVYNIEPGAVLELPTLDYDEILSEKELELILTSETYEIAELETETLLTLEQGYTLPPPAPLPEGLVTMSAGVVSDTWSAFDSWGLTGVYLPLAIVSIAVFVLRGAK